MSTLYEHRLILIIPADRAAAVATWMNGNLGANTVPADLGPALSADGGATTTHRWCSIALQDGDGRALLNRICTLAGVATPTLTQWRNSTRAQKRTWLAGVRDTIRTNYGAWLALSDNAGAWDDPDAQLATLGLTRVEAA